MTYFKFYRQKVTSSKIFENFLTNLSELLFYITSQNLVLIALIELKLSPFFYNDVIETDCVTCFFDGFQNVKISFWPIF